MTREQAQHILSNIDLIRHFAEGGDIGHRLINCAGEQVRISPVDTIILSNMHSAGTHYVKVKPKFRWNDELGAMVRQKRSHGERVKESEIIQCDHAEHVDVIG